jgi:hypothetical protein
MASRGIATLGFQRDAQCRASTSPLAENPMRRGRVWSRLAEEHGARHCGGPRAESRFSGRTQPAIAPEARRARLRIGVMALVLLSACNTVRDRTLSPGNTAVVEQPDREADRLRSIELSREPGGDAEQLRATNRAIEATRVIDEGTRLLRDAEAQLRAGNPTAAIRILEDAVRRFSDVPVHDRALYELASALVLTGNATGEYLPAVAPLERLLREHPRSAYAGDARALRMVIGAYVVRTAERDRLSRQLKAVDLEIECPPVPLASGP